MNAWRSSETRPPSWKALGRGTAITVLALLIPASALAQKASSSPPAAGAPPNDDACIAASDASITARKAGKLLEARTQLATCAAATCPDVVRTSCEQRLNDVTARLPSIVFDVKDPDGHDVTPVKLTIDGILYTERLGGASVTLDPVDHAFTFEVSGQAPVTTHFVLHEREARRELITIGTTAKPAPVPPPEPPPPPIVDGGRGARGDGTSTRRTVGYSLVGVGVIAAGFASAFGLDAMNKQSDSKAQCPTKNTCYAPGKTLIDDAKTDATVSTVLFVVSGLAAAGGVTIVLLSPSPAPASGPPTSGATHGAARAPLLQLLLGAPRSLGGMSLAGAW